MTAYFLYLKSLEEIVGAMINYNDNEITNLSKTCMKKANHESLVLCWAKPCKSDLFGWKKTFFSLLVITQKGKSQTGCFKKIKHFKFSEKRTFLAPWYALLETPVLRFALLSYYRAVVLYPYLLSDLYDTISL